MKLERAEHVDELHMSVGDRLDLESLRAPVIPPHLMLKAFLETPEGVSVEGEQRLDEDGVHGSVYQLRADKPGKGELVVGFRDPATQEITHSKTIKVDVE